MIFLVLMQIFRFIELVTLHIQREADCIFVRSYHKITGEEKKD